MTDYGLTPQQIAVIDALSSGATMTAAAGQVGAHRNTVAHWRRNNLAFQHALAHAQYDRALLYREKSEELADVAARAIRDILDDPKTAASVRLRAALAVMNTISKPPEPKPQVQLDIEKIVIRKQPPQEFSSESFDSKPAPIVQNCASQPQTIRRDHPKVGRNDICPCGSGQKFKRCCVDKPKKMAAQPDPRHVRHMQVS
jgi:transposase-like protein